MPHNIIDLAGDLHHMINVKALDENSNVVDAGASDGRFLVALNMIRCDAKYYGLEPSKSNFSNLLRFVDKLKHKENLTVRGHALVGENYNQKTIKFKEYEGKKGRYFQWGGICNLNHGEIEKRKQSEQIFVEEYDTPVIKLSEIIDKIGVIDYLKMDIEGAEKSIIMEMGQKVANKINQMSLEYHYLDFKIIVETLKQYGFKYTIVKGNEIYASRLQ